MRKCATGKVRYYTEKGALESLRKVKKRYLTAYRCAQCEGWHLGTNNEDFFTQAKIDYLLGKDKIANQDQKDNQKGQR